MLIFSFPLNLAPGKYTVTVAIHKGQVHSEGCYHWADNITQFQVAGYKKKLFTGLVYLPIDKFEIYKI